MCVCVCLCEPHSNDRLGGLISEEDGNDPCEYLFRESREFGDEKRDL